MRHFARKSQAKSFFSLLFLNAVIFFSSFPFEARSYLPTRLRSAAAAVVVVAVAAAAVVAAVVVVAPVVAAAARYLIYFYNFPC